MTHLGTVTSVGSNQFTVKDRNGRVATVMVDSSTRYQQPGRRDPGFSDIKTGMNVGVYGMRQAPAKGETGAAFTLTALRVQLPRVRERFGHLTGRITSISDSAVTLSTGEGRTVTATITSETKKLPSAATFAVGDRALLFVRYVEGADMGSVLQMVKLGTPPPSGSATATATATGSATATPPPSASATATATATGSATATATGSATSTATATGSATGTPTATSTGSATATATRTPNS